MLDEAIEYMKSLQLQLQVLLLGVGEMGTLAVLFKCTGSEVIAPLHIMLYTYIYICMADDVDGKWNGTFDVS